MSKNTWQKKLLCIAVTIAMAVMFIPMMAFAEGNIAEVDGTGYTTVQEAIDNGNGKTVKLLADVSENVTVAEGTTVTLDLNGFKITNASGSHTITNKGTLTIQGSGTVDNINHACAALWNEGTAVLNGGTFDRSKDAGSSAEASGNNSYYTIVNHGTMTIYDGVAVTQPGKYSSLLENGWYNGADNNSGEDSLLTIEGGTFSGGLNTIKNDDYGKLIIKSGNFTNVAQAALLNWNEAEITGGTFEADETSTCVVLNGYINDTMDAGKLTISGGTFTGGEGTDAVNTMGGSSSSGDINISGGEFKGDIVLGNGNKAGGTLNISGSAVINGNVSNTNMDNIKISGGSVSGTVSNTGAGTTEITGGAFAVQPSSEFIAESAAMASYTKSGETAATYYVGADTIADAVKDAANGDAIEVISGNVSLDVPNGGVTITNNGDGNVTVNDTEVPKDGSMTTHTHEYTYKYDENGHWQECSCGDKTEAESHTFGEWIIDKEATEAEAGSKHRECSVCGYSETEVIAATETSSGSSSSSDSNSSSSNSNSTSSGSGSTSSDTSSVAQPQTGENGSAVMWAFIAVLAVAGVSTFVFTQRKRIVSGK